MVTFIDMYCICTCTCTNRPYMYMYIVHVHRHTCTYSTQYLWYEYSFILRVKRISYGINWPSFYTHTQFITFFFGNTDFLIKDDIKKYIINESIIYIHVIHLHVHTCICLSIYICLSIHLFLFLSICLTIHHLHLHLYMYMYTILGFIAKSYVHVHL